MKAWLSNSIITDLKNESKKIPYLETGGCLMGYWWHKYSELVITDYIGPGPKAIHKSTSFKPDFEWQQKRIHEIYQKSDRHITYLGDWHSHPEGDNNLSRKDINALKKISLYKQARAPVPIMGILSGNNGWDLTIWQFKILKKSFFKIHYTTDIMGLHIT